MSPEIEPNGHIYLTCGLKGTASQMAALQITEDIIAKALHPHPGRTDEAGRVKLDKHAIAQQIERILSEATTPQRSDCDEDEPASDFALIPLRWFTTITKMRGRGKSRSLRAYHEAIHLLGYITYHYRTGETFYGRLLRLNSKHLCETFAMSIYAFREAMRYLGREGYIYRVVYRGFVPWRQVKRGTHLYVVPRVERIEAATGGAVVDATPKGVVHSSPRGSSITL